MTEDDYAATLKQIADEHDQIEKVRRITEGLITNPAGSELRELGDELAEVVGVELPAELADDNSQDRARDAAIDRETEVSW